MTAMTAAERQQRRRNKVRWEKTRLGPGERFCLIRLTRSVSDYLVQHFEGLDIDDEVAVDKKIDELFHHLLRQEIKKMEIVTPRDWPT